MMASVYNLYIVLTAKVIKHPFSLEMGIDLRVPLQQYVKSTNFAWP